ncbi:hypothetical protein NQ318_014703 [Aromia moschata]|uniref:Uncharacterized protein n=1 Tax=Aromia moschata TaxID=1265417 RepID=A0AAV8ZCT1_9CUCU|nr:hypothetical protein NQ318_014703 [Aromia moschata]
MPLLYPVHLFIIPFQPVGTINYSTVTVIFNNQSVIVVRLPFAKRQIAKQLLLTTLREQHKSIYAKRAVAKENLVLQATKMIKTSKKKFPPAHIGDTVRIQVPDIDRGRTDPRNVLAVVVGIEDSDFYKLATKDGTLKQLFTRNQFVICKEKLLDISTREISLREAAFANSRSGGQGYTRCNCKKKCPTTKCSCKSSCDSCAIQSVIIVLAAATRLHTIKT